jgi:serine/threonine protein kinase
MMGGFELRHVLGQGAQATVWLGFDPRLQRQVAIKLLRSSPSLDSVALQQWLQEAHKVAQLTHPHIVPILEAGLQDGQAYLVFEYVPGQTLAQHLHARSSLPAREAVQLMLDVLGALQAAHEVGVVHLDLKPSNILVDASGLARVTDFGPATRSVVAQTGAGGRGSAGYMAPDFPPAWCWPNCSRESRWWTKSTRDAPATASRMKTWCCPLSHPAMAIKRAWMTICAASYNRPCAAIRISACKAHRPCCRRCKPGCRRRQAVN